MAGREYKLTYTVEDGGAASKLRAIRGEILAIDQAAQGGKQALGELAGRMGVVAGEAAIMHQNVATATGSVQSLGQEVGQLVPAWQAFQWGIQLAEQFGDYMNQAREHLRELAREAMETRDRMRELANLQDHASPDNEVTGRAIGAGVEAGLTPDQARQFLEQFEGSIPAGREKGNLRPELEQGLVIEAMKFGTRVALDPKTAGDLAGVLPQYGPIQNNYQAAGIMGKITANLNAGRGNLEPLTRSLIKTAGSIVEEHGGPVEDLPTLAALLGVASTNATPDRAGTMVMNAVRGLRKFEGARTPKEIAEYNREHDKPLKQNQGQTLQDLGITPEMKFTEALDRIAPKILEADSNGTGGDVWLRQQGFGNEDEIRALVQFSRNLEVVHKRVGPRLDPEARQQDLERQGVQVMHSNEDFFTKERTGIARRLKAKQQAQDFLTGEKGELSEMAMQAGRQRLREKGQAGGMGNQFRHWFLDAGGILPKAGLEKAEDLEAKSEFSKMLAAEAARVGVDAQAIYERRTGGPMFVGDAGSFNQTEALNETIEAVVTAGGKPFGTDEAVQQKLRALMKRDQARRGAAPAAAPPLAPGAEAKIKADVAATLGQEPAAEVPAALPGARPAPGAPGAAAELPGGGGPGAFAPAQAQAGNNGQVVRELKRLNQQTAETNKLLNQQAPPPAPAGGNGFRPARK